MDKNAIKKYAVWARRELIERVSQRAMFYGVTSEDAGNPDAAEVHGRLLSPVEKKQRQALFRNVREKGFDQVMEEVAYTWFNRFAALRFMEVNGYLPSLVRVFTNEAGEFKPQILSEALHLDLEGLDKQKVLELESGNKSEELFRYLLIVQCNALNSILPGMFQKIEDYTELLLPDNLLRDGSVIEQLVSCIPEEDWTDQVQIIGWLYQFYNIEQNELVYDGNMAKVRIPKELLPAATTIYTPDWPVRYMVENSLGRLWLEGHPNNALQSEWKYYLDEAEQEAEVQAQLDTIRKEYAALKPEEIRVIDPCMGSGHILCVLFDILVRIYEDYGYTSREAASKIVENNLWGLDIDERAAQLSYFAVMMKARQYDRRFFTRNVQPHVYAIEESNGITSAPMHDMGLNLAQEEYSEAVKQAMRLVEEMRDTKEYGSIIHVTPCNWDLLRRFAVPRDEGGQLRLDVHGEIEAAERLQRLITLGIALSQKYDVVVTNPPYLGATRFSDKLNNYVKDNYPCEKADLSMVMYKKAITDFSKDTGFVAFITTSSWLFLSSFVELREYVSSHMTFSSIVDYGTELFEGKVGHNPITSWVTRNTLISNYKHTAIRLVDYCYSRRDEKESQFLSGNNRYYTRQENYTIIPDAPIAYWLTNGFIAPYEMNVPLLGQEASPCAGLATGNNDIFQRYWYEVAVTNIGFTCKSVEETKKCKEKWFPCNSGGEFRKWYPADVIVVDWQNDGEKLKGYRNKAGKLAARPQNTQWYFKEGFTWNKLSSSRFAVRYKREGFIFDDTSRSAFPHNPSLLKYYIGLLCSNVTFAYLRALNPTMSFTNGDLVRIPIIVSEEHKDEVERLVDDCISISSEDWDTIELSWDFTEHPFITSAHWASRKGEAITIKQAFEDWKGVADGRFERLKTNEERINEIFTKIFDLNGELSSEVEDKDVTVRKADYKRDVRSFISYAVGCMFGRYSLDTPGLIYAGGEWDASKYPQFQPDKDAIIPICDDEYFEDDIVGRFVKFVEAAFGKATLEENLRFIADALGGKGSSREVIRSYFINDFYADHLKVYQKRPIYWLFDSGKKNGFKCLIYMHRYQPDTIARIRTDYVHEQQSRYRTVIADLEHRVAGASPSERVKLTKQLSKIRDQAEELRVYEEKIHHLADQMISIDLDDGVKVNYAKFQDVLAKIK